MKLKFKILYGHTVFTLYDVRVKHEETKETKQWCAETQRLIEAQRSLFVSKKCRDNVFEEYKTDFMTDCMYLVSLILQKTFWHFEALHQNTLQNVQSLFHSIRHAIVILAVKSIVQCIISHTNLREESPCLIQDDCFLVLL